MVNLNVANYLIYFPLKPGQEIGLEDFTPPYMAPTTTGNVTLKGVNYASGAGGICNETGIIFVSCFFFSLFNRLLDLPIY